MSIVNVSIVSETKNTCWFFVKEIRNILNKMDTMEKGFEKVLEELKDSPGVEGCVFADNTGLGLGAKGHPLYSRPGIVAAISEQASKIEPQSKTPIVQFESDTHSYTILRKGNVTCALYRNLGLNN